VKKADEAFRIFMGSMLVIFLCIFILLNLMLRKFIIKPVMKMSYIADEVSKGNMDAPMFNARGNDEITRLATSFERMRISLEKAMKMLS
jgi:protein-histidine pros-kinase